MTKYLQPSAPAVLPGYPDRIEIAPGAGGDPGAGVEFDRIVSSHRQRESETQA